MLTKAQITKARSLLDEGFSFYLASNARVLDVLDTAPGGLPVTPLDFLKPSPEAWSVNDFMRVYNRLNGVAFDSTDLGMPMWVMVDLALLPSAFLLITLPLGDLVARQAQATDEKDAARMAELIAEAAKWDFTGPIPIAGYCAAPSAKSGHWIGWSVCAALEGRGHASLAKAMGLHAYGTKTLLGITQFNKRATRIHRKFGRMRIVSAMLPLHTVEHTYVYETDVGVADDREISFVMDATDIARQLDMQSKIDAGTHAFYILFPGLDDGRIAIHEEVLA